MTMTLGYWDIRGVREQSILERGRRRVDGEMLHSLGAGSTKTVLREGRSPARFGGLVNGSVCVCVRARAGWEGSGLTRSRESFTQSGPSIPDHCRGSLSQLAHAIRLLLEYTDSNYEEKKYTMGDGNGILFLFRLQPSAC